MAFGSGSGQNDGALPIAEINITPLTDVMLVLLIIAMVIAPTLAFKGKDLQLPDVEQAAKFDENDNLLQVDADGALFFNQEPITMGTLGEAFQGLVREAGNDTVVLIIAADPSVSYQQVLDLWNLATAHGVEKIVLAGEVVDQFGNSLLEPAEPTPSSTVEGASSPPNMSANPFDPSLPGSGIGTGP